MMPSIYKLYLNASIDDYTVPLPTQTTHMIIYQSGQMDLKHFDPEFVREPVPGEWK